MTTPLQGGRYGRDTSATDIICPGIIVTGPRLVGEALYRRFITERGSLEDDRTYGLNLVGWLQSTMTPSLGQLLSIRSQIIAECLKDERVASVDVTVNLSGDEVQTLSVQIAATLDDTSAFTLALSVNDITVELLDLQEAA